MDIKSLPGYNPWGSQRVGHDKATEQQQPHRLRRLKAEGSAIREGSW